MGGSTVEAPKPRNLTQELIQIEQGYQQTAPGYLALAQQYTPAYSDLSYNEALRNSPRYENLALGQERAAIAGQPLLNTLNQQANTELAAGGNLTPSEERDVAQRSRGIFAARGMAYSGPSAAVELLNRDAYRNARLQQRQGFAGQVQNMDLASLGTIGRGEPPSFAPVSQGTGLFNPFPQYAQDLNNTNYNAQAAANIANANKSSGTTSGALGALGSIAGGVGMAL